MAKIPGSAGFPLIGDKSYDFYRDPIKFLNKNIVQYGSKMFYSRLLNKPTVFVGSNKAVQEMLNEKADDLEFGYKAFMGEVYGENILFANGREAEHLRHSLLQLFIPSAVTNYREIIDRTVEKIVMEVEFQDNKCPCVYSFMKRICTEICLSLFLDLDFNDAAQISKTIVSLTTTHWHGIISVPLPTKLPMTSGSTYSQVNKSSERDHLASNSVTVPKF